MSKKYYITILIAMLILVTFSFIQGQKSEEKENKSFKWTMVTAWPKDFPIFQTSAEKFAEDVRIITKGQLDIRVIAFDKHESINNLEDIFNAVSGRAIEMGHATAYYWADMKDGEGNKKVPGCEFFSTIPFGLNAEGMHAWLYRGGGLELWRELYEPFNIIPFPVGNTGPAMGGWFNKKIERIFDLKGLKIRIAGLGGKVYREARADTVLLPANKILSAFEKKSIDAAVFQGPFHDQWLGLDKCNTKYYYYPGWHEPGTIIELIVNKQAWEGLPEHIKETIKSVAGKSYNEIYTQFERMNFERMKQIQEQREVELKKFPDTVIEEFKQLTRRVLEDEAKNKQFKAIYDAYKKFEDSNEKWKGISIVKIKNRSTEIVITKFINEVGFSKNLAIQQEGENSAVISLIGEASFARARKFNEPTDKQSSEIKSIAEIVNNNNLFIKTIRVVDYTYDKKNKFKNLKLSMKRADAIKKLLIDKGVAASLIKVNPLGESAGDSKSENKIEIIVEFKED